MLRPLRICLFSLMESDPALTGPPATSFVKRLGERNICVDLMSVAR